MECAINEWRVLVHRRVIQLRHSPEDDASSANGFSITYHKEQRMKVRLSGVLPPIPTPFDAQGDVAHPRLVDNLLHWNNYELTGYVVLGSNGEVVLLTKQEKLQVLETARRAIPPEKLLIAGTGCESTRETIALTREAAEIGASAALLVTPHYYGGKMSSESLTRHFYTVADASPIPVLVYNVPKFTHLDLDATTVARLSEHPNIIGLKDSGGNITKLADVVRLAQPDFQVLAGSAGFFFAALTLGAVGGVLALANVAPRQALDIYRWSCAGRLDEAAELQRRMVPVNAAVTARFGIAGLKAAMDMLGFYGGPVRGPLLDLVDAERKALREVLMEGEVLPRSME
jgi:4-hydroxy-2-oxoglutarate aldolase